jgi:hypothetical protein
MRKWASVAIAFAALVGVDAGLADTPPDVYNDFASDGVLNCGHSRSALEGALNDASIYQYGDPLTFIGLKLAIRRQLAGGCRQRRERTLAFLGSTSGGNPPAATAQPQPGTRKSDGSSKTQPANPQGAPPLAAPDEVGGDVASGVRQDGWMVLLGVLLLLLTLGSGGWAARRAFTD